MEEQNRYLLYGEDTANRQDPIPVKDIDDLIFAGEPIKLHSEK